jgi:pSer/pThr/pTyr-binding forkhead associated (FHA) protein
VDAPPLHRSSPAELKARLDAERRGIPFLVLRDGDRCQRILELAPMSARLTIGRQPSSDVALPWDDEVSRAHADVECIGEVWTLVDDGRSRNGSFVNGERVHGRRALRSGDVVRVGNTSLTFVAPAGGPLYSTVAAVGGIAPAVTPAQRRVLVALCRPYGDGSFATPPSNRELAAELCLSAETIKVHLHDLFAAFGLAGVPQHSKRATLARLALEGGAIAPGELRASDPRG